MALKFLNKKGWHTGSLRNIETVWKAEQKHEAEQKKLEELKKQILDEREAQEFRSLQEQAGLVPKQERLEFLYNSGLAVGKSSTEEYLLGKPIDTVKGENEVAKVAAAPGSLFVEEKPVSANDTWRKLHTDPLLLIRQQEQAALARIKNNPVKMDLIKKAVEEKLSEKEERRRNKREKRKLLKEKKKSKLQSDNCEDSSEDTHTHSKESEHIQKTRRNVNHRYRKTSHKKTIDKVARSLKRSRHDISPRRRRHDSSSEESHKRRKESRESHRRSPEDYRNNGKNSEGQVTNQLHGDSNLHHRETISVPEMNQISKHKPRYQADKLSEQERAARLKEMQADAEIHEEQRWHRLKRASEADVLEEARKVTSDSRNFIDVAAKNIYGAEKGGSASVEESVRRRTHFINRTLGDSNVNTFQRL